MEHFTCILKPHYIFMRVKVFTLMLVPGGLKLLVFSTCFAWRPIKAIYLQQARTRIAILIYDFLFINIWLLISCDTGIYAIIVVYICIPDKTCHRYEKLNETIWPRIEDLPKCKFTTILYFHY